MRSDIHKEGRGAVGRSSYHPSSPPYIHTYKEKPQVFGRLESKMAAGSKAGQDVDPGCERNRRKAEEMGKEETGAGRSGQKKRKAERCKEEEESSQKRKN